MGFYSSTVESTKLRSLMGYSYLSVYLSAQLLWRSAVSRWSFMLRSRMWRGSAAYRVAVGMRTSDRNGTFLSLRIRPDDGATQPFQTTGLRAGDEPRA